MAKYFAIREYLYNGNTLTRTIYMSTVFVCKNAAQEWVAQNNQKNEPGKFTRQFEITVLTPQIVNEIRHEYGSNSPTTVYRVLSCHNHEQ